MLYILVLQEYCGIFSEGYRIVRISSCLWYKTTEDPYVTNMGLSGAESFIKQMTQQAHYKCTAL